MTLCLIWFIAQQDYLTKHEMNLLKLFNVFNQKNNENDEAEEKSSATISDFVFYFFSFSFCGKFEYLTICQA